MTLTPQIRGAVQIRSTPAEFLHALRQRLATGFLAGKPHTASNYVVTQTGPDRLHVHAADWRTAMNVGLNEVDLELAQRGTVSYQVRYWRWASFAVGLCGVLGLIALVLLLTVDIRAYIAGSRWRMISGLSVNQNLIIVWAMALFWGFLWPWVLIGLHKPVLQRLMKRLITEVDAQGSPAG
jgi:hypothetical protein